MKILYLRCIYKEPWRSLSVKPGQLVLQLQGLQGMKASLATFTLFMYIDLRLYGNFPQNVSSVANSKHPLLVFIHLSAILFHAKVSPDTKLRRSLADYTLNMMELLIKSIWSCGQIVNVCKLSYDHTVCTRACIKGVLQIAPQYHIFHEGCGRCAILFSSTAQNLYHIWFEWLYTELSIL